MSEANGENTSSAASTTWQAVGALFGLVIPIGYAAAYFKEWGYCVFFGIPLDLIKLDITNILITITYGVGVIFFIFWFAELFYTVSQRIKLKNFGPIKRRISFDILFLFLLAFFFTYYRGMLYTWPLAALLLILVLYSQFVAPLIIQGKISSYSNKLEAQDRLEMKTQLPLDYFVKRTGITIVSLGTLLGLFLIAMMWIGINTAEMQRNFLVPSTNESSVVLRIYGDTVICAPFDIKTKEVEKTFFIIRLDDESRPEFRLYRLGPLTSPKIWVPISQD